MTTRAEAIFENNTLRLTSPVAMEEGARVEVLILTPAANGYQPAPSNGQTPAQIMAEIVALPVDYGELETSSVDHDTVLYGA